MAAVWLRLMLGLAGCAAQVGDGEGEFDEQAWCRGRCGGRGGRRVRFDAFAHAAEAVAFACDGCAPSSSTRGGE